MKPKAHRWTHKEKQSSKKILKKALTAKQRAYDKAYRKEINRIRRFKQRAESRGYIFEQDIIPQKPLVRNPKSLEKVQQINVSDLYKYAKYYDERTDETFTGEEGRRIEKFRAQQKRKETLKRKKEQTLDNISNEPDILEIQIVTNLLYDFYESLLKGFCPPDEITYKEIAIEQGEEIINLWNEIVITKDKKTLNQFIRNSETKSIIKGMIEVIYDDSKGERFTYATDKVRKCIDKLNSIR